MRVVASNLATALLLVLVSACSDAAAPSTAGDRVATLTLDPAHPPETGATTLTLLATEQACASGEPPTGRAVHTDVDEGDDSVTVIVTVDPFEGPGTALCPMSPAFPVTLTLTAPLGTRQILDGSTNPATPVAEPAPGIPTTTTSVSPATTATPDT